MIDWRAAAPLKGNSRLLERAGIEQEIDPLARRELAGVVLAAQTLFSAADTGFIGQNVYLFCASEGLATVVRANVERPALAKSLSLRPDQRIILSQTVGYPKAQ